jgi:hypothetical protein
MLFHSTAKAKLKEQAQRPSFTGEGWTFPESLVNGNQQS